MSDPDRSPIETGLLPVSCSRKVSLHQDRGERPSLTPLDRDALSWPRPKTRGDCLQRGMNEWRPCPYYSCRYHLALDVQPNGTLTFNFPDKELHELIDTCALDAADQGGMTLEEVGVRMNVTRERARQIETRAMMLRREQLQQVLEGAAITDPEPRKKSGQIKNMDGRSRSARSKRKAGAIAVCDWPPCQKAFVIRWRTQLYCSEACAKEADDNRKRQERSWRSREAGERS